VGIVYGMTRGSPRDAVISSMTLALRRSKFNWLCVPVLRVNPRTLHLTLHFPFFGFLPVILGTGGSKPDYVVSGFQFADEYSEIITRG